MLKIIIEKELLARFSDTTFVIACILSAMLIFLSFYLSVCNYSDLVNDYNSILELNRNSLKAQKTYEDIENEGIRISKPPEVLAIFNVGIANYIGRNLHINSYSTSELHGSKIESNPVWALFGDFNLTFIIKYILSLLAVVFSYNMLSGEKEGGTLRLVASFPVPRDTLILGKLIGGLLCLFIPLLIPMLLGMAVLLLLPNIQFESDDYLRLILIFCIFLLYLTVFFLVGAFVSARTKSSSISFLVGLFIWVMVVLVIPKSSSILATQFIHVPSSQQYRIEKTQLMNDIFKKYYKISEKLLYDHDQIFSQQSMEQVDIEIWRERSKRRWNEFKKKKKEINEQRDAELEKEQARMEREYQQRQQNLANLAITFSRISPASAMTYATANLADTGMDSFRHFIRLLRGYRERYIAFIKTKIENREIVRVTSDGDVAEEIIEEGIIVESRDGGELLNTFSEIQKSEKVNLNEIPVFTYQKMSFASVLQATLIDILLLVLLCLLLFIGTYVSFFKYDVR